MAFGEVPTEWDFDVLGNCVGRIIGGGTPSRDIADFYQGEIPWVTVKDLNGNFYKGDSIEHITEDAISNSATNLIEDGTVIIATRMGLGRGFINLVPMAINQDLKALCPNKDMDSVFLLYWYLNQANIIEAMGKGSTVKGIRLEELKSLTLLKPPLPEQHKIADILSTVDRQIDQTNALIEKTKELKKGLMQRLLTKGVGHKEFKVTEIGEVPVECVVKRLGDIFKVSSGTFLPQRELVKGEYPVYGGNGITGFHDKCLFNSSMIVIGRVGAKCGCIYISESKSWITDNALYVSEKCVDFNNIFMYYLLIWLDLNKYANQSAQPVISGKSIYDITIGLPSIREQKKIADILSSIDDMIFQYQTKKQKLQTLKKALMQKILTGKVRVKVS